MTHSARLHQAQLLTYSHSHPPGVGSLLLDCKSLNGNSATIEFDTTELTLGSEYVVLWVIDEHGNFDKRQSETHFQIDMAALLPESDVISIPDANLAAVIRETLGFAPGTPITQLDMLGLDRLNASQKQITNLTGLEHATRLKGVNLSKNSIVDLRPLAGLTQLRLLYTNENKISDISPLAKLTHLSVCAVRFNQVSDISPLAGLNRLVNLSLDVNQVSDISPLAGLNRLVHLGLDNNSISDISPLAELTNLENLALNLNEISDVEPLATLTNLEKLYLNHNEISDVEPLATLTNLRELYLIDNPIKDREPLLELLRKNPDIKIYLKSFREPLPVNLSHFRAELTDTGIVLKWITESEVDNAGFYIYRSQTRDGEFKVVNTSMIQGAGTTGERNEYTWTDTTAKPNTVYYYRIEDVSHAGEREQLATVRLRGFVSAKGKMLTQWADFKMGR